MAIQTSSNSRRERWVKALLPAVAVLAVYLVYHALGPNRKLKELNEELGDVAKNAVTPDMVANSLIQKKQAQTSFEELQTQIRSTEEGINASIAIFTGASQTEQMMAVGDLCRQYSVGIVKQQDLAGVEVSALREKSLRTLKQLLAPSELSFRQLDLVGRYSHITQLLKQIPETVHGVLPVGIELVALDGQRADLETLSPDQRMWRVYLVM
jgi:hypothetical protein